NSMIQSVENNDSESLREYEFIIKGTDNKEVVKTINELEKSNFFSNIFVYNREYLLDQIELKESSNFEAIIMFGEDAEDLREIERLQKENETNKIELEKKMATLDKCKHNIMGEVKYFEQEYIRKVLNQQKSRSFEKQVKNYRSRVHKNGVITENNIADINNMINELEQVRKRKKEKEIAFEVKALKNFLVDTTLLSEVIPPPSLNEKEKK